MTAPHATEVNGRVGVSGLQRVISRRIDSDDAVAAMAMKTAHTSYMQWRIHQQPFKRSLPLTPRHQRACGTASRVEKG